MAQPTTQRPENNSKMSSRPAAISTRVRSPFLEGLAPSDVDSIVAAATPRRFLANSVVASQGERATNLFLLTKGHAKFFFIAEDGRKFLLHWMAPGEIAGVLALVQRSSLYLVGAEMAKGSCALVWDRATILSLAARFPRLLNNAVSIAGDYVTLCINAHVALTTRSARQRLAQVLLNLARNAGKQVRGGVEIEVTNEELANAADVTVFTASRLLSEWQRQKAVAKSRGKILLRSKERLFLRQA